MSEESCWKVSDIHNLETSLRQISQYSLATSYTRTVRAFRGMIGRVVKKKYIQQLLVCDDCYTTCFGVKCKIYFVVIIMVVQL